MLNLLEWLGCKLLRVEKQYLFAYKGKYTDIVFLYSTPCFQNATEENLLVSQSGRTVSEVIEIYRRLT